jgi:hypothetical protein
MGLHQVSTVHTSTVHSISIQHATIEASGHFSFPHLAAGQHVVYHIGMVRVVETTSKVQTVTVTDVSYAVGITPGFWQI